MKKKSEIYSILSILGLICFIYGCSIGKQNIESPVKASDREWDKRGATEIIQSAIDSGADQVKIPDIGSVWHVDPIFLASNQKVILEEGVVIAAKEGSFLGKHDCLFNVENQQDVSIIGYGAVIEMKKNDYRKQPYEKSEWRHAISLRGCRDVLIEGLTIRSSGGDGIYIGRGEGRNTYCENVIIKNVVLEDNYRQGISVISVRNLVVEDTRISNTGGTAPGAGIDFEPNHPDEILDSCLVRRCTIEGNRGSGLLIYLKKLDSNSIPVEIEVWESKIAGNRIGLWISGLSGKPNGTIHFCDTEIIGIKIVCRRPGFDVTFCNQ